MVWTTVRLVNSISIYRQLNPKTSLNETDLRKTHVPYGRWNLALWNSTEILSQLADLQEAIDTIARQIGREIQREVWSWGLVTGNGR